jgi:hypothetical protein
MTPGANGRADSGDGPHQKRREQQTIRADGESARSGKYRNPRFQIDTSLVLTVAFRQLSFRQHIEYTASIRERFCGPGRLQ